MLDIAEAALTENAARLRLDVQALSPAPPRPSHPPPRPVLLIPRPAHSFPYRTTPVRSGGRAFRPFGGSLTRGAGGS